MGDKLSYEELFKKNKKRGRSGRMSMTDQAQSSISDVTVNECNMTMTKSLRKSMFNEPMSVRGIKRIEIEEIEKIKAAQQGKSPDAREYTAGSDSDADSQENSGVVLMSRYTFGIK